MKFKNYVIYFVVSIITTFCIWTLLDWVWSLITRTDFVFNPGVNIAWALCLSLIATVITYFQDARKNRKK